MISTPTDNRPPFGIDFAQWPRQWQAAGALLLEWPLLRRMLQRAIGFVPALR